MSEKDTDNVWILRDLSNGNGRDTYVWVWNTREQARRQKRQHREDCELSNLGVPDRWTWRHLRALYAHIQPCALPNYWKRKYPMPQRRKRQP